MFKSLFLKYVFIFMIIIFASFIILTSIMTTLVSNYATRERYMDLQNDALSMTVYLRRESRNLNIPENGGFIARNDDDFQTVVDILSVENEGTVFFVASEDGDIYIAGVTGDGDGEDFFSAPFEAVALPADMLSELENGNTVSGEGNMDGVFSSYSIYVGVPLIIDGNYSGSVFAGTTDLGISVIVESMIKTLIVSSLWIMLATSVAIYYFTQRMVRPIREMSIVVKEFTNGNFDHKIKAKGRDEMSDLAISLNTMADSIKSLEYMRSSFVSNVSHELRTPMTTIGGFVDSILEGAIPPEHQQHYLEIISSEVKRLSRLVTSFLEISKMEQGKMELNFEDFDICEIARIILISNEQRLDEKKLDVEFICPDEHIYVRGDKDRLHQVLFNICDNAIKFSYEGGKYIISIARDRPENEVTISVYNEGNGIPEEDLPFVFDRFYKSDKSRSLDKTGVGLGLFIVKSIVVAHGGTITAESECEKWCKFTVKLKCKD